MKVVQKMGLIDTDGSDRFAQRNINQNNNTFDLFIKKQNGYVLLTKL